MTEENEFFKKLNIHQRMMNFLLLINKDQEKKNDFLLKLYKIKPHDYILKNGIKEFLNRFPSYKKSEEFDEIIDKLFHFYEKNGINSDIDKINVLYIINFFTEKEMYEKCFILNKKLML